MNDAKAKRAYQQQKRNAAARGIEWRLTYEQWRDWWGSDLPDRGVRQWSLGMQRPADKGAYELSNIRKGTPKDNARTRSAVRQNTIAADIVRECGGDIGPPPDAMTEDEQELASLGYASVATRFDVVI